MRQGSTVPTAEQPSPSITFESSHSSPGSPYGIRLARRGGARSDNLPSVTVRSVVLTIGLISHSTWGQIQDEASCTPMGEVQVESFHQPIEVCEVEHLRT